jgi:hypothetical protein
VNKEKIYWFHTGKKTYILVLLCLVFNFIAYFFFKNATWQLWTLILSTEYLILEMLKRYNDKQGSDFI